MFIEKTKLNNPLVLQKCQKMMDQHDNLKKIQVCMHAKYLSQQAQNKQKTEDAFAQESIQIDDEYKKVTHESLYDSLYDQNGKAKTSNTNQKVVIQGGMLDILETHGNNISF